MDVRNTVRLKQYHASHGTRKGFPSLCHDKENRKLEREENWAWKQKKGWGEKKSWNRHNLKNPKADLENWVFCVCVERIDQDLLWEDIEDLVNTTLLRKNKAHIIPFAKNRGPFMGDNWADVAWLDAHGSRMILLGLLVFHKWSPILGAKMESSLTRSWAHILTNPTNLCQIPRIVKVSDGEATFQVLVIVEEDDEEDLWNHLQPLIHPSNPDGNKWFSIKQAVSRADSRKKRC